MGELLIRRSTQDPSGRTALSLPGLPRAGEPTVGSGITLEPRPRSRAKWQADSSPSGPPARARPLGTCPGRRQTRLPSPARATTVAAGPIAKCVRGAVRGSRRLPAALLPRLPRDRLLRRAGPPPANEGGFSLARTPTEPARQVLYLVLLSPHFPRRGSRRALDTVGGFWTRARRSVDAVRS